MNMDDWGGLIAVVLAIAAIIFVVYVIVLIASVLAAVAGGAGVLWGGGTAIVNYGKSFKENMIDSNAAAA
jgi:hypothetical protein